MWTEDALPRPWDHPSHRRVFAEGILCGKDTCQIRNEEHDPDGRLRRPSTEGALVSNDDLDSWIRDDGLEAVEVQDIRRISVNARGRLENERDLHLYIDGHCGCCTRRK